MAGRRRWTWAGTFALALGAAAAASSAQEAIDLLPLMEDDLCSAADSGACVMSALQRRSLVLEAVDGEAAADAEVEAATSVDEASRRRKNQAEDLSVAWTKKLYSWIVYLDQNLTHLEWKMYYIKLDINSTNNTLFGIPMSKQERGVNGTKVNWNKHPATWLPTFVATTDVTPSLAEIIAEPSLLAADADGADAQAVSAETEDVEIATSGRRRHGLSGVPPRKKQIQTLLLKQQDRLNNVWHAVTLYKRRLDWMGNYMGANRRLYHGRPVFVQATEARVLASILEESRWSDSDTWTAEEPQTELVKQIKSGVNQTVDLWSQMRLLGGMVQATKRRVRRWLKGKKPNLLQDQAALLEAEAVAEGGAVAAERLRKSEADWSIFGTMEQCCLCRNGTIGWSASGKCRFCDGDIKKKQGVESDCSIQSSTFKGSTECAESCKTAAGLHERDSDS